MGLVEKDLQTRRYSLGPGLIFLSRSVLDNLNYTEIVAPLLDKLAKDTNGTAVFGLIQATHVLVVGNTREIRTSGSACELEHRFHITLGSSRKSRSCRFYDHPERKGLG